MTENEFREKFMVRQCDKCCATCKHGRDLCDDDVYNCVHPKLEGDYIITSSSYVCDAWEGCSS